MKRLLIMLLTTMFFLVITAVDLSAQAVTVKKMKKINMQKDCRMVRDVEACQVDKHSEARAKMLIRNGHDRKSIRRYVKPGTPLMGEPQKESLKHKNKRAIRKMN